MCHRTCRPHQAANPEIYVTSLSSSSTYLSTDHTYLRLRATVAAACPPMADDAVDKSLLARLQALRGGKREAQEHGPAAAAPGIKFDPIERRSAESPTGNDILAARLKSLRAQAESDSPKPEISTITAVSSTPRLSKSTATQDEVDAVEDDEDETFLVTDDAALEEMLAEPHSDDEDVVALLEELTASIPADTDAVEEEEEGGEGGRDGLEGESNFEMPSIPDTLPSALDNKSDSGDADLDDLTARMAALRSDLPSVPASKPARVNRLTSKTGYTDSDMDSWCIVCLEDATLRCLGCDDDAYCHRCWKEMHVGPAAYFDDRSHRAVQFTRDRKKVALGA